MQEFILKENVLTNNVLTLADEGKIFKGGYIAILKEYTFETHWTDKLSVKKFRNQKRLDEYLTKHYPKFDYYN